MFLQKLVLSLGVLAAQEGIPSGVPSKLLQLLHVPLRSRNAHINPVVFFGAHTSRLQGLKQAAPCDQ